MWVCQSSFGKQNSSFSLIALILPLLALAQLSAVSYLFILCAPAIRRAAFCLGRTVKSMNFFAQLCGQSCKMVHKSPKQTHAGYCFSTKYCKKYHVAEQPQGGTNSTQRISSVTSSSKKGHASSSKMHKPLLQSNKLSFWVSWIFMMIWLVMVRNVSKKSTLPEKCLSIESEMFCRNVPIWTRLLTKLTKLCLFCSLLIHLASQMLPEGWPHSSDPQGF